MEPVVLVSSGIFKVFLKELSIGVTGGSGITLTKVPEKTIPVVKTCLVAELCRIELLSVSIGSTTLIDNNCFRRIVVGQGVLVQVIAKVRHDRDDHSELTVISFIVIEELNEPDNSIFYYEDVCVNSDDHNHIVYVRDKEELVDRGFKEQDYAIIEVIDSVKVNSINLDRGNGVVVRGVEHRVSSLVFPGFVVA